MSNKTLCSICIVFTTMVRVVTVSAQGIQPYPNATTDRLIRSETPMSLPVVNVPFVDPDFGSRMIRVTDEASNFKQPGSFLRTEGSGNANVWSADTRKFYVVTKGGSALVYSFNPSTLSVGSLPAATPGRPLLLPLRTGGSFSFKDPDLIYGTTDASVLKISSYRFSTGVTSTIIDTTTCGVQPPLIPGPRVRSDDDVTPSLDDRRISISEGGPSFDKHMFVIVYDKSLGCRWYNTQTGQIGGQWGSAGGASIPDTFLIGHAYLSRSGDYVRIGSTVFGWYVWDVATLNVTPCRNFSDLRCFGYTAMGYNSVIQNRGFIDPMDTVKRPFSNIAHVMPLIWPLPTENDWEQEKHFTWNNVDVNDSVPVCGSTHNYDGDTSIEHPFDGEIFCIETDGVASTVWRFAHNRATYIAPFFQTQPLGSVSMDGQFFLFTSNWDNQLGKDNDGQPRSDVFILKLD
jgi:hypothetical protein